MELIPVSFHKIMQSHTYTVIILGTDSKRFAIYTAPDVGREIQRFLTKEEMPRPYTHDLLSDIFRGFNVKILQIVINDVEDTIYFARLFLEQQVGDTRTIIEIDARPSDCIPLALMNNTPVFCRKDLFDKVLAVEE